MKAPIATLVLIVSVCIAESPSRLDALKQSYESAKSKALEPIVTTFKLELKKLMEEATRKSDLAEIEKITAELKSLESEENDKKAYESQRFPAEARRLTRNIWTWETKMGKSQIKFEMDGTAKHSNFVGKYVFQADNIIQVETDKEKIVLTFDWTKGEYTGYGPILKQKITGHDTYKKK